MKTKKLTTPSGTFKVTTYKKWIDDAKSSVTSKYPRGTKIPNKLITKAKGVARELWRNGVHN